jgi:hypothetical protein
MIRVLRLASHLRKLRSPFSVRPLTDSSTLVSAAKMSIGTGNMMVEFFSTAISVSVCR